MALFLPLLFVFLWSTGFVVAALVSPYSEPMSILTLRFVLAAIVLLGFGLVAKGKWPNGTRLVKIIISGILIHGLYLCGVFWGVKQGMPAGVSALLTGLQPLVTAIAASPLLGEQIKTRHWFGLVIGLVGCALVVAPKLTFTGEGITVPGIATHIIAVLGIGLGSIYQKKFVGQMDFKTEPGIQLLGGLAVALPVALMTESFIFEPSLSLLVGYLWMTIILSCGAFTLLMYLLQYGEASKVASLFYLVPVCAAIQGYLLFGDLLTPIQIVGMVVTAGAVLLVSSFGNGAKAK